MYNIMLLLIHTAISPKKSSKYMWEAALFTSALTRSNTTKTHKLLKWIWNIYHKIKIDKSIKK